MAERQMQAMALVVHQMICDGELFNSKKLSKITVIVRTFFKKISFILYIKYIPPSSRLRIFMSVINFVHKMSPLFGVYYRFCAQNVLTFFVHFIFCVRNVFSFYVRFFLLPKGKQRAGRRVISYGEYVILPALHINLKQFYLTILLNDKITSITFS